MTAHLPPQSPWPGEQAPLPPPPAPKAPFWHSKKGAAVLLGGGLLAAVVLTSGNDPARPVTTPPPPAGVPSGVDPTRWTAPAVQPQQEWTTPMVKADSGPARKITSREWALIAKDPNGHVGERVIVYGQVMQFDASTGSEGFRANVDGIEHKPSYGWADYKTNTILRSDDQEVLADLVEDDLFRAEVTVAGAQSYETAMGATLTVPHLTVTKIETIGHV